MIHWLSEEAVQRARAIDFQQAYHARPTLKLAAASALLVLLALAPVFGSDAYARFGRRLILAWSPAVHGFFVNVTPGDQYVGRGRSAAVTVQLQATEAGVKLPKQCVLVCQEGEAAPRRVRMEPTESGDFSYTWPAVTDSLTYHIEAGDLASAIFRIEAVDPVALAPGSPVAKVTPPPYVQRSVMPAAEHVGQVPFTALQYSRLQFVFALDRPAQKATVRWRAEDGEKAIALELSADRKKATWEMLCGHVGPQAATLTLEADHGITSTYPLSAWSVWADDAPWFSAAPLQGFSGFDDRPKLIAPNDIIPIKAVVEDQVGIERVELEYRINDGPIKLQLLADGAGQKHVAIETSWRLQDVVKIGDHLQCRLRVADNRRLSRGSVRVGVDTAPEQDLLPNVGYLPSKQAGADAWWSFKIERQAESLAKQHVMSQRDEFADWIDRIKKQLDQERQQVQKVKFASHQQPVLSAEQSSQLAQAHKKNQVNQQELRALGQKAGQIEGLQNLARLSFDIARRELGESDQALEAGRSKSLAADQRERELAKADQALLSALKRLGELHKVNELLAQERLEVKELEKLAAEEKDLAKQADDQAALPKADQKELDRLRAEQAKIAERLQKLAEQNPRLQQAAQKFRQAQAQKLAKEAQSLAMKQRKMSQENEAKWQAELKAKFADLAKQQRELAGKVETLGRDMKKQPTIATLDVPIRPALGAADQLRDGLIEPALAQQKTSQDELQALADQMDKALALDRDPRTAAQRLAKMQDDLHKQLQKVGDEFQRVPIEQTRKRLAEIAQAQKTLHEAVGKLEVPKTALAGKKAVQELTGSAANLLQAKDAYGGFQKMEQARDALSAWANSLPATPQVTPPAKETAEEIAVKKQAVQAGQLAKEQRALREAVAKRLKDLAKSQGGSPQLAQQKDDVDKLAQQLMELSQKAAPESKHAAEEAAQAVSAAKKEMAKSQAEKDQGRMEQARQSEAEAALQLEMAARKADESAQAMSGPPMGDPKSNADDADLQKAFEDSQMKLEQAGQQLQQKPQQAGAAMQQAAKALEQTARQAQKQMASQSPPKGNDSPAQSFQPGAANAQGEMLPDQFRAHAGKNWGDLPGELRTRIVQDLRVRYGDEYGPIIQRYFQQIADVPATKKPK